MYRGLILFLSISSIVFIPGLGEQQLEPWTSNGTLWPKDFLPKDVENARILYPGYTGNFNEAPTKYADEICAALHHLREESKTVSKGKLVCASLDLASADRRCFALRPTDPSSSLHTALGGSSLHRLLESQCLVPRRTCMIS